MSKAMPSCTFKNKLLLFEVLNIRLKGKQGINWPYIHHSNISQMLQMTLSMVVNVPHQFERVTFTPGKYHF